MHNRKITLTLLLLSAFALLAQQGDHLARVTVLVTDRTNAVVEFAQVRICPGLNNSPLYGTTNESGQFAANLAPGSHEVYITHPVFEPWLRVVVVPAQQESTQIVAHLKTGDIDEVVEVCATCPTVDVNGKLPPPPPPTKVTVIVSDPSGAVIPKAQVWGLGGAKHGVVETDNDGKVMFSVRPGGYHIAVTAFAFARWKSYVQFTRTEQQTINVRLQMASYSGPVIVGQPEQCAPLPPPSAPAKK